MFVIRDLGYAVAMEAGFAASRHETYREKFNDMVAMDGMNYAREAYAINALLMRAKQDIEVFGRLTDGRVIA